MLKFAKILSKDWDFLRVDFFVCNDDIYFGEMTHYPASGLVEFKPVSFDFDLGKYWKLNIFKEN